MQTFITLLLIIQIFICLLLVGIILMQLPRSEGLGVAFGGGMTDNLFGADTTNVLTKITVWLGIGFFVITLALAVSYSYHHKQDSQLAASVVEQVAKDADAQKAAKAAETPAPTPEVAPTSEVAPASGVPAGEEKSVESPAPESAPVEAAPEAAPVEEAPAAEVAPEPASVDEQAGAVDEEAAVAAEAPEPVLEEETAPAPEATPAQ